MSEENPLVSIIVRTKDRPILLKNAVRSIAAQTYRPIEVVLVNDGGCDLDIEELKSVLGDVSLNYIRLEKNKGRAHAGNVGMENAQGEYMGFLDDDDKCYRDHIAVLVSLLEKYDYKFAYADANIAYIEFDPESKEIITTEKKVFSSQDFSYNDLIMDNYIPLICALFSKDVFSVVQGFDESFDIYEDWDLLIRIAEKYPFYHVKKTTVEYVQWSSTLQIAQTSEFAEKARVAHGQIINKHKEKFTADVIRDLVQNRRALPEREAVIANLEKTLQERERTLADLEDIKASLERTLQEREDTVASLEQTLQEREDTVASLERTLQVREDTLDRIYSSRGWKCLLFYYGVRDTLLPHNSKRRVFVKAIIKAVIHPLKIVKNLNVMNIRKFFHYLKNADPSVFEYKINKKLSANSGSDSDPSVSPYDTGRVNMPVEKNSVLLMGNFPSAAEGDISKRVEGFIESLKGLHYDITVLDQNNNVEEYLKTYGGRFSFVIGTGPEYCYAYFPFVRAYVPNGKLIYLVADLQDDMFTTELLNASISDCIIVDAGDKKQKLLHRNTALKIEVIPDTPDMKNDFERVLSNLRQREQSEVCHEEKTFIAELQKEPDHDEENRMDKAEGMGGKSVLVVGIYLANQKNTIEHIVDQMNRSKQYHVVQKWIALGGDAPSENVKAVTTMKIDHTVPKFQLLNKILSGEESDKYAYVVISDDDITLPDNFLDDFISLQEKYDFAAAQPARTHNSYIDHSLVERLDGLKARRTRFVEIGPLVSFRHDMLSLILPFDESTPMGWGFDFVLPCIAENHGFHIGIIDATPVDHSIRKPMRNYRYDEAKEAMEHYLSKTAHLSREEAFTILESYT